MKVIIERLSILALFFMVVSCATIPGALPEKYNLGSDLEEVDRISAFKDVEYKPVDNQSIMLTINWTDYYLLVLRRPIDPMYSNSQIRLSRTTPNITSGIDRVFVGPSGDPGGYVIERIFKLKGKEQAKEIKERLQET